MLHRRTPSASQSTVVESVDSGFLPSILPYGRLDSVTNSVTNGEIAWKATTNAEQAIPTQIKGTRKRRQKHQKKYLSSERFHDAPKNETFSTGWMYYEPFLYFAIELLRGAEKVSEPIS
jgi:hypothetical protein